MSSKKLVHLYVNSFIRLSECLDKGIVVRGKELNVLEDAGAKPATPKSVKFLQDVFMDQEAQFIELKAIGIHAHVISFRIGPPNGYFLKHLRNAFQQPFIQVVLKANTSESRSADTGVYDYHIELINAFYKFKDTIFFATIPRHNMTQESNFGCNISFGWTETEVVNPHARPIKIGTASFMLNLYEREASKDLTIVAGNGAEIKCHKIIFEAHSDVLAAIISPTNGMVESQTGRIEMKENSEEGLSHLMRYLYGVELAKDDLSCDVVVELFKTAHKYQLTELQDRLGDLLLCADVDWFTPDDLLELYFHVKNVENMEELHERLLIMLSNSKTLTACERFEELQITDSEAAADFVRKLCDKKQETECLPSGSLSWSGETLCSSTKDDEEEDGPPSEKSEAEDGVE